MLIMMINIIWLLNIDDNDDMMRIQRRKKKKTWASHRGAYQALPQGRILTKDKDLATKAPTPADFPAFFFFFIFLIFWICHEAQTDQHKFKIKEMNWVGQSTHLGQSRHPVHLAHPVIISHSRSGQCFRHYNDWHGHILVSGLRWVC